MTPQIFRLQDHRHISSCQSTRGLDEPLIGAICHFVASCPVREVTSVKIVLFFGGATNGCAMFCV